MGFMKGQSLSRCPPVLGCLCAGCLGLAWLGCPYHVQGSLLSMEASSCTGGEGLDTPFPHLCSRACCPLSGASAAPCAQATPPEPGLGHSVKPLESQRGRCGYEREALAKC